MWLAALSWLLCLFVIKASNLHLNQWLPAAVGLQTQTLVNGLHGQMSHFLLSCPINNEVGIKNGLRLASHATGDLKSILRIPCESKTETAFNQCYMFP